MPDVRHCCLFRRATGGYGRSKLHVPAEPGLTVVNAQNLGRARVFSKRDEQPDITWPSCDTPPHNTTSNGLTTMLILIMPKSCGHDMGVKNAELILFCMTGKYGFQPPTIPAKTDPI
jgi:hypothetical protein